MAKCRTCGAEIKWCEMKSGKKMPLDDQPKQMVQIREGIGEIIYVYMPHWATCGDPNRWKKGKK